jgi:hypothetical protein
MIFIEGRKFTGSADKGEIAGAYYYDSNPISNFTVSSDIQTPSVYFKKVDTVDLNAVESSEEIAKPVETKVEEKKIEPTKPKEEVKEEIKDEPVKSDQLIQANAKIKSELLELQPNNKDFIKSVNNFIPDGSALTPSELKLKID